MDLSYVKKLVKLLSESDVDEVEIEEEGKRIRVAKHARNPTGGSQNGGMPVVMIPAPQPAPAQPTPAATAAGAPESTKYHEIKSPIVGTFYKSPAPDAAPFVEIGTLIQPGTVLCIVEAMKLMNEIEADVSGKVIKVMVENGQPVEYGQPLFLVDKA
ncbi:MAG TPA: acetyl-CoA carboxylase biotin carboxyl carrier protein [Bacteroidota bacterium]|jgi:acetyl-CoA carboxylase biotin carboxyl carrier protein|nr:acetyl-CoA carboxylase biotin carboxyl carrier protein [Bacteroidota bacterium]